MLKLLFYGILIYFLFRLYQGYKQLTSGHPTKKSESKKDPYQKFDIRDAEYEDVKNEKGKKS